LIAVIDASQADPMPPGTYNVGLYSVFLKELKCGELKYGRSHYDYQEGTLVFIGPGQVIGVPERAPGEKPKGWALIFHPDLIKGTTLGKGIHKYGFFSYEVNEALHLSEREKGNVVDSLCKIQQELEASIDNHSRTILVASIDLLLSYCTRFYERQFITRDHVNKGVIERFDALLHGYFATGKALTDGLPSVSYFAGQLNLSANYFGDLVKKETGRSPQEHIQSQIIDMAKEKVLDADKSISEVAYEMGFKYPQHFTRLFKQKVGLSPNAYRNLN
jgi:AraC-like DNA-binding protein